jgi:hypothetical protein
MASIISAGTTSGTALNMSGDTSGVLQLASNGSTTAVTIDTSQNVGIGTASPTRQLTVYGSSPYIALQNSTTGATSGDGLQIQEAGADAYIWNYENSFMSLGTNATERMRILSGGSVYIGTTSGLGSGKLQVYSLGTSVNANNANNTNGDINMVSSLGANCNNSTSYSFLAATGGADKCYILGNGNLQNVNNSYGTLSDIKLKENIVDATPKLADIMRLQVRNFNLKSDPDHKQIGFVAQEIEQVFPSIIEEISDLDENRNLKGTTTKGVKTSILVPMLVKAIQELKAINDTQAETINALTARIVALEAK